MFNPIKSQKPGFLDRLREKSPTLYFFVDLGLNILIILVLVYTVRTFLISPFQVYGPSMCDNLNYIKDVCQDGFGDYLIVNKAGYYPFFGHRFDPPERGDIIVFRPPHNNDDFYIKRIIGLPGEKIKLQNGKVFIFNKDHQSGFELPEEYLNEENRNKTYPLLSHMVTEYEVAENTYFVLGDNRKKSSDSRTCFRGPGDSDCVNPEAHFLHIDQIEGRAWIVLWPFSKIRILHNPEYGI